jgi:hypothetical protein
MTTKTENWTDFDADPLEPVEPSPETLVLWVFETIPDGWFRDFHFPFGWTEQEAKRVAAEMLDKQESYLFKGCRPEHLRFLEKTSI